MMSIKLSSFTGLPTQASFYKILQPHFSPQLQEDGRFEPSSPSPPLPPRTSTTSIENNEASATAAKKIPSAGGECRERIEKEIGGKSKVSDSTQRGDLEKKSRDGIENDESGDQDIRDSLTFNVLLGIAIMVVVLSIGSAMLYAVQKILVSSSQHHQAEVRSRHQAEKLAAAAAGKVAIVHPKDLSAYLYEHNARMRKKEEKAKKAPKKGRDSHT